MRNGTKMQFRANKTLSKIRDVWCIRIFIDFVIFEIFDDYQSTVVKRTI